MIASEIPRGFALLAAFLALGIGGCTSTEPRKPAPAPIAVTPPPQPPTVSGPVLTGEGTCTAPSSAGAGGIEIGIGECDLVRLKGKPPTDVLIGEGRSGREVQVLYTEPGARELYFFVNNRLDRIVK